MKGCRFLGRGLRKTKREYFVATTNREDANSVRPNRWLNRQCAVCHGLVSSGYRVLTGTPNLWIWCTGGGECEKRLSTRKVYTNVCTIRKRARPITSQTKRRNTLELGTRGPDSGAMSTRSGRSYRFRKVDEEIQGMVRRPERRGETEALEGGRLGRLCRS